MKVVLGERKVLFGGKNQCPMTDWPCLLPNRVSKSRMERGDGVETGAAVMTLDSDLWREQWPLTISITREGRKNSMEGRKGMLLPV